MIIAHINNGLMLASDSFLALWEHKKLLVYLLIPALLNLIFGIHSAYDFVYALISRGAPTEFTPVIKAMVKAIVADLGIACISVHMFTIIEHQRSSVRDTIRMVVPRAPIIATWSIIAGAIIYGTLSCLSLLNTPFENMGWSMEIENIGVVTPATGLQIILGVVWIMTVFFMIQILALEKNTSIVESLKHSWKIARAALLEIIGGEFWIGLIWALSVLPLMILFEKPMAYYLFNNKAIHDWSGIAFYLLILIGWICASAQAVFRTKLYHRSYIEPREEEIDVLFYPRF